MATIRRPGAASAAVLVGLIVSLGAAHLLAPEWARAAGLDVWNYAALDAQKQSLADERADMDAKAESDTRRRGRADQLAARLIAGEDTLPAVSAEIGQLFINDTGWQCALAAFYPDLRDPRLLHARHTIDRAVRQLDHDPSRKAALRVRLEAEYRTMESQCGSTVTH
ncbi:hypothetical protein GobsT_72280 [Gemmata obscuriglobus]|uniref:Uncharacterized protein n=1 Tax=Gemmata obscuriglobus TaxID=114 RepID=A0A2Z3HFF4_9BACT|nr:hypothetical protein [Gemmata obscuriglobus]AWM41685.1 hypothetical protein C1280_34945 [Gemmata obscuriglobus]QEG32373.1 hypothetical protein GobsT_72280 [Gemmata obscuriglobus]VTS11729.1 unnamed protein product [Gemmata obscuriglobus UQM 2246]